uniref:Uncharacterized protein n=1 Tax=Ditylenchus dipsaci TaxID=166011 RepID=A0A915CMH1_9BILA
MHTDRIGDRLILSSILSVNAYGSLRIGNPILMDRLWDRIGLILSSILSVLMHMDRLEDRINLSSIGMHTDRIGDRINPILNPIRPNAYGGSAFEEIGLILSSSYPSNAILILASRPRISDF